MEDHKNNKDIEENNNNLRFNSIYSSQLDNIIKNLTKPRFLGSIHLEKQVNNNISSIENLIKNEHQSKLDKSIRNSIFNPFTKILIIIIVLFNILWFSSK
ncbi:MAG: hypothetical protein KGD57_03180, partial [Candidatus Lokiarchaeota archaeon]|nr:hypothetical protein [Candidatus Lokiarchaeota archaeon]